MDQVAQQTIYFFGLMASLWYLLFCLIRTPRESLWNQHRRSVSPSVSLSVSLQVVYKNVWHLKIAEKIDFLDKWSLKGFTIVTFHEILVCDVFPWVLGAEMYFLLGRGQFHPHHASPTSRLLAYVYNSVSYIDVKFCWYYIWILSISG